MFMPTENRIAIYSHLFKAGAVAVKKDAKKESHDQVDVPNLHMMKEMVSFKSRGFVTETFSWQWNYYFLTDAGIDYLRKYLHIPEDVVPDFLKPKAASLARAGVQGRSFGRGASKDGEAKAAAYRK